MALSAAWMLWLEPPRIRGKATQASTSTAMVPTKRVKPVRVARFLKAAGSLAGLGLVSSEGLRQHPIAYQSRYYGYLPG